MVDDEQAKATSRKEDEKVKKARIESLNEAIAEMKKKNDEAQELDEERTLKALNKECEELIKRKEEQDEKLMAHKTYQNKLFKQQVQSQATIDG